MLPTDRKYNAEVDDPDQIKSGGGTLVLTSPDITITPTEGSFSNGNCEVTIADLPTINTLVIAMYYPSGKNFSLAKYSDAMTRIRTYQGGTQGKAHSTHG